MATYRPFIIIAAIAALLLVGNLFHLTDPLVSGYSQLVEPVLASETTGSQKTINFFTIISTLKSLASENASLKSQLNELKAQLSHDKEIQHENDILHQELNFTQQNSTTSLPAELIGQSATGVIKDLVVDKGSGDGVQVGQPVLAQGFLVGTVRTVTHHQATVMLLTNPGSLVPVLLQDSRATGILRGGISGLTVTDLLIDATIHPDETVVTSGLGGTLPSGIPIGKVIDIITHKGDITKKTTVGSPIDTTKLEIVFIKK